MDGELVSDSSDDKTEQNSAPKSYSEIFNEHFPYYLSIGMTYEQYWEKDCKLVEYYRAAEEIRADRLNQQAWLQGMYIYDAITRLSPILQAFPKKGTRVKSYVEQPYPLDKKTAEKREEAKEKATSAKGLKLMTAFMDRNNQKYNGKG